MLCALARLEMIEFARCVLLCYQSRPMMMMNLFHRRRRRHDQLATFASALWPRRRRQHNITTTKLISHRSLFVHRNYLVAPGSPLHWPGAIYRRWSSEQILISPPPQPQPVAGITTFVSNSSEHSNHITSPITRLCYCTRIGCCPLEIAQ